MTKKKITNKNLLLLMLLLSMSFASCTGENNLPGGGVPADPIKTASIKFKIAWQNNNSPEIAYSKALKKSSIGDCSGISTVEAHVYDHGKNIMLKKSERWDCNAHKGTIKDVPVGEKRTVIIIARASSKKIVYRGEKANINVEDNKANDAGLINVFPSIPTGVSAGLANSEVSINWDKIKGALSYNIYINFDSNISKNNYSVLINSSLNSYTLKDPEKGKDYYFAITSVFDKDDTNNESVESEIVRIGPLLTVEPALIIFGDIFVNSASNRNLTITNTGISDLLIGTIANSDLLQDPFNITSDNCSGQTLVPTAQCTLIVNFFSPAEQHHNDSFDIPSNNPEGSIIVHIDGGGITPSGYKIFRNTFSGAVGNYEDEKYKMNGIMGQSITGNGKSSDDGSYIFSAGFY